MNKLINVIVAFSLLAIFDTQALSQRRGWQKVFAPVAKEYRANLIQRLRLLTRYERTQQRDKSYDLLFGGEVEGRTREEFVKWRRESLGRYNDWFMDFTPEVVEREVKYPQASYKIIGTCKLKDEDKRIRTGDGYLYARWREGEWYFSDFHCVVETFW